MTDLQSKQLKKAFLAAYSETANISTACKAVGLTYRGAVYDWNKIDPEFAEAFKVAQLTACDSIDREIHRRGALGYLEPVFQGGQQVGEIRKFSDTLLIFLAKGLMPQKYRERYDVQHSGKDGGPMVLEFINDWRQQRALQSPDVIEGEATDVSDRGGDR